MVNEVNKIIFNTLLSNGAIYIPGVGTLTLVRVAAQYKSSNRLTEPCYKVDFSTNNTAISLVDIIANKASVEVKIAQDICDRWLDKVSSDSRVTIEGVGTLHNMSFVMDESLASQLNPFGEESLKITTRKNGWVIAVVMLLLLSTVGTGIWWYLCDIDEIDSGEEVVYHEDEIASDNNAQISEYMINDVMEIEAEVQEQGSADEIANEVETTEEISEPKVAEQIDWRDNKDIRHWVVIGSYSTVENAEHAIEQFEAKDDNLKYKYIRLGSMYAVTPYGSTEKSECERFVQSYREDFSQVWIYTPRKYRD